MKDFLLSSSLEIINAAHAYDKHIRKISDNITAIAYINDKGGVKSIEYHRTVEVIWEWAIERRIVLPVEHIPGSQNVLADNACRVIDVNTEWELSSQIYAQITDKYGEFDIDLFASRLNAKNVNYVSWKPDPNVKFIDVLLLTGVLNAFMLFPPSVW